MPPPDRPTLGLAEWRDGFPEFASAEDPLVQVKLSEAHRCFDHELFGALYLDAVAYKTAVLLASSPFGTNARLEKSVVSTWSERLAEIEARTPATPLVIQHR